MALNGQVPYNSSFYEADHGLDLHNDDIGDDNDGWGVDAAEYTTELDTDKFTRQQIEEAIRLEREIMSEGGAGRAGYEYAEESSSSYYGQEDVPAAASIQTQRVNSTEEALRMLKQQAGAIGQPPARAKAQPRSRAVGSAPQRKATRPAQRAFGTPQDEIRAYKELCKQYRSVQLKLAQIGEPTPQQKKMFLQRLTRGLIGCLRYPVPEVRNAVGKMFLDIGWDVRRNKSPPHVRQPPTGEMMKELLAKTVDFFGSRHGLPDRRKYTLPPRQNSVRPRTQAPRGRSNQRHNQAQGARNNGYRGRGRGGGQGSRGGQASYNSRQYSSRNQNPQRQSRNNYGRRNNSQPRRYAGPP